MIRISKRENESEREREKIYEHNIINKKETKNNIKRA